MSEWDQFKRVQDDDWGRFKRVQDDDWNQFLSSQEDGTELERLKSRQRTRLAHNFRGGKNWNPALVGAKHGFDRAALGLKGLFTDLSDEDKLLLVSGEAATEEGGGPGAVGRIAGEIAATGGPAALARKGLAYVLPRAIKRWSTPGVASGVGARVFSPGTAAGGVVEGAVAGGILAPGEGESRVANATIGGFLGGFVPAVGAVVAPTARWVRREFSRSPEQAAIRAARTLEKTLGPDAYAKAVNDVRNHAPTNLPLSTAALADDSALARLERGSRNRSHTFEWDEHDAKVYQQAWEHLQQALRQGEDAPLLAQQADELVKKFKKKADSTPLAERYRKSLSNSLLELKNHNEALANPQVMKEIDNALIAISNPESTLGVLPQLWFKMGDMAYQSSAVAGARDAIRKTLDARTKGGFSQMLEGYGVLQDQLKGANAALNILDDFMSPQGVVRTKKAFPSGHGTSQVPEIQASVLRQSVAKRGEQDGQDLLGPQSRTELNELIRNLGRHDLYRSPQTPGSTALDSGNLMNIAATGRDNPIYTVPGLRGIVERYVVNFNRETAEIIDHALRNPDEFLRIVATKEALGRPLSTTEKLARQALFAHSRAMGASPVGENYAP